MDEQPGGLEAGLDELASLLLAEETLDSVLQRVVHLACNTVEGCDGGTVTLLDRHDRPSTVVSTDPAYLPLDDAQYGSDQGPCVSAIREQATYLLDEIAVHPEYPAFADAARLHGVASSLSLPLGVRDTPVGALNLYAGRVRAFGERDLERGQYLAHRASVAVANARLVDELSTLVTQLQEAMTTRGVIEQAKGILMARERVDADGAFDILRRASQRANRKLHDLAQEIVERAVTGRA